MQKRETLKLVLKMTIGLGLVVYVLQSKMVDIEMLRVLLLNPWHLLTAFCFLSFSVVLCTARWYLLVKPQGLSLSFSKLLSLSMIGLFFNTFMPGSVGGDLIKAWYVAGQEPDRRTKAIFTVLVDRVLGLAVIIFYAAFTLLFYTEWLENNVQLKMIALAIWGFTGAALVLGTLFFIPSVWKFPAFVKLMELIHRNQRLGKIIDSALLYRNHAGTILWATLLSAISILGVNLFFSQLGGYIGIPMDLPHYFFVVPLALVASAVPLLPGGIGTGQVAFYTLFLWMGMSNPDQGGTLCTVYQIYSILFNCLGAVFYFRFKRKAPLTYEALHTSNCSL